MRPNHATTILTGLAACLLLGLAYMGRNAAPVGTAPDLSTERVTGPNDADRSARPVEQPLDAADGKEPAARVGNAEQGTPFPNDRAGQMLSKLLPPPEKAGQSIAPPPSPPRPLPAPARLEQPTLPLPPPQADAPHLVAYHPLALRPRPAPEDVSLSGVGPGWPPMRLPAGDPVRVASPNIHQPLPLPVLAQPVNDRAPFDDTAADLSVAAAQAAKAPPRSAPAPFLKVTRPEPFENWLPPVAGPPEDVTPSSPAPRPPRKP